MLVIKSQQEKKRGRVKKTYTHTEKQTKKMAVGIYG